MSIEETLQKIIKKTGLSREEVLDRVEEEIEKLNGLIDKEGALILVAKDLKVDLEEDSEAAMMERDTPIKNIKKNSYVNIIGRVESISDLREFSRKDGSKGSMFWFYLRDTSGRVRVIVWDPNTQVYKEKSFTENSIIRVVNGSVKESKIGPLEVHVGTRSKIQIDPDEIDHSLIPHPISRDEEKIYPLMDITLSTLTPSIEVTIKSIYPIKTFRRKDGTEGKRAALLVEDDSGSLFVTFWDNDTEKIIDLNENDYVRITHLRPRKNFRDPKKIDLFASRETKVIRIRSANENFDKIKRTDEKETKSAPPLSKVKDLLEKGNYNLNLKAKVIEVGEVRTVHLKAGGTKRVLNIIVADETGSIPITLWEEHIPENIKVGDCFLFQDLWSKFNNFSNRMEATLSRNGSITPIEEDIPIDEQLISTSLNSPSSAKTSSQPVVNNTQSSLQKKTKTTIEKINKDGYYTFEGTIVKEISRITVYDACSKCFRKIQNCKCQEPGESVPRIIVNLIVDDESQTIRVTLMGDNAENFIGESAQKIKQIKEAGELETFLKDCNLRILGKRFYFEGKARYSDFSDSYEINVIRYEPFNPEAEAHRIAVFLEQQS